MPSDLCSEKSLTRLTIKEISIIQITERQSPLISLDLSQKLLIGRQPGDLIMMGESFLCAAAPVTFKSVITGKL